jgi:hypothetical protein
MLHIYVSYVAFIWQTDWQAVVLLIHILEAEIHLNYLELQE